MSNVASLPGHQVHEALFETFLESVTRIERVHRALLDVIKDDFDRHDRCDINPVQVLLLYNIGDHELTAGELRKRGYYLGSNVSYNLKKMVAAGFVDHQRSQFDRRSVRIRLTDKGKEVRSAALALFRKHLCTVEQGSGISVGDLSVFNKVLDQLERFWNNQITYPT